MDRPARVVAGEEQDMNDRELLEAAAKAAGIDAEWHIDVDADFDEKYLGMFLKGARSPDNNKYWNPLTDDGDALRLAVKLGLRFCAAGNGGNVSVVGHSFDALGVVVMPNNDDPYAATRRAIVRAAAEIGRSKK